MKNKRKIADKESFGAKFCGDVLEGRGVGQSGGSRGQINLISF